MGRVDEEAQPCMVVLALEFGNPAASGFEKVALLVSEATRALQREPPALSR